MQEPPSAEAQDGQDVAAVAAGEASWAAPLEPYTHEAVPEKLKSRAPLVHAPPDAQNAALAAAAHGTRLVGRVDVVRVGGP